MNTDWISRLDAAAKAVKKLHKERNKWQGLDYLIVSPYRHPADIVKSSDEFRTFYGDICEKVIATILDEVNKEIKEAEDKLQKIMSERIRLVDEVVSAEAIDIG